MKNKTKKLITLLIATVMVLGLTACGGGSEPKQEFEKMEWKFACSTPENTPWTNMGKEFGDLVSEATDGAVTVKLYPTDQLTAGNQTEGIQGVIDGTIDLSAHSNLIYSSFDPRLNVVSLPFLFSSYDEVDAKLNGEAGEAVGKVVEDMGLHLLGIAENGFRQITNNKHPIEQVSDMKGLKIRVAGSDLLNRMYELWGANYSNANWSEVYLGLQTGSYDGQENPLPSADGASISEVQKYCTVWTGVYDCVFFTMNLDLYNSLSPELQKIVDDAGKKAAENERVKERAEDEKVKEKWKEAGVQITELSPEAAEEFRKIAEPCYTEFADDIGQDLIDAFTDK